MKNMYYKMLFFLALLSLLSATQCDEDCFDFFSGGKLEVDLESPVGPAYALGDTLWLAADFSANLSEVDGGTTISENGGLFVSRLFRIGADSSSVEAALDAFTPLATAGTLIPEEDNNDPAASILRYTCPAGRCGFRQGFRLNAGGQYLLQVSGSGYDVQTERLSNCSLNAFSETTLNAASNLEGVALNYPLIYTEGNETFFEGRIDTSFQRNLLLFTVE